MKNILYILLVASPIFSMQPDTTKETKKELLSKLEIAESAAYGAWAVRSLNSPLPSLQQYLLWAQPLEWPFVQECLA